MSGRQTESRSYLRKERVTGSQGHREGAVRELHGSRLRELPSFFSLISPPAKVEKYEDAFLNLSDRVGRGWWSKKSLIPWSTLQVPMMARAGEKLKIGMPCSGVPCQ